MWRLRSHHHPLRATRLGLGSSPIRDPDQRSPQVGCIQQGPESRRTALRCCQHTKLNRRAARLDSCVPWYTELQARTRCGGVLSMAQHRCDPPKSRFHEGKRKAFPLLLRTLGMGCNKVLSFVQGGLRLLLAAWPTVCLARAADHRLLTESSQVSNTTIYNLLEPS